MFRNSVILKVNPGVKKILKTIFTGRNEVVAKVMFLHVCVILFTGGGSPGRENPPRQGEPPRAGRNPPGQGGTPRAGRTPRQGGTPPGRENPPLAGRTTPWQGEPPPQADTPPEQTPPRDQTPLPPGSRLQHTVNERPVRILLECILVIDFVVRLLFISNRNERCRWLVRLSEEIDETDLSSWRFESNDSAAFWRARYSSDHDACIVIWPVLCMDTP